MRPRLHVFILYLLYNIINNININNNTQHNLILSILFENNVHLEDAAHAFVVSIVESYYDIINIRLLVSKVCCYF